MRFLLDENVDVRVGRVLRTAGHWWSSVGDVNLGGATDRDIAVYADDRGAVVVTHDRAFSRWRSRHVFGHHVYLRCREEMAAELIEARLADVVDALERGPDVYVELSVDRFRVERQWGR